MIRVTVNVTGSTVQVEFSHQEKKSTFEYVLENRTETDVIRVRQASIPQKVSQRTRSIQVTHSLNNFKNNFPIFFFHKVSSLDLFKSQESQADMETYLTGDRRDAYDYIVPPGCSVPFFMDDFRSKSAEKIQVSVLRRGDDVTTEACVSSIWINKLKHYKGLKYAGHFVYPMVRLGWERARLKISIQFIHYFYYLFFKYIFHIFLSPSLLSGGCKWAHKTHYLFQFRRRPSADRDA